MYAYKCVYLYPVMYAYKCVYILIPSHVCLEMCLPLPSDKLIDVFTFYPVIYTYRCVAFYPTVVCPLSGGDLPIDMLIDL